MKKIDKEVLSVRELAAYLGFSRTKIYRLLGEGGIPAKKIGGQYRFAKSAIDRWLGAPSPEPAPAADALARVREEADPLTRNLLLVGRLTREVSRKGLRPVVVGGQAVELYTAGGYATRDIDLVASDSKEIGRVLTGWGFRRSGRYWTHDELGLAVEIPGATLAGDRERITEVEIEGLTVYVIGIEDIILDRLNALVHWKSPDDGVWAREMAELNREDIDWGYLEKRAAAEDVLQAARTLRRQVGRGTKG